MKPSEPSPQLGNVTGKQFELYDFENYLSKPAYQAVIMF